MVSTDDAVALRNIAEIKLTRVKAHLVLEPELSLIDCGYAGSSRRIARAIEEQGRALGDLKRVLVTHGHPDHAGSAGELAASGATIRS